MDVFDSSNRVEGKQTVLLRYDVSYAHRAGSRPFTLVSKLLSDLYISDEVWSQLRRAMEPRQIALLHHKIPVKAAPLQNVPGSSEEAVPVDVLPEHTTVFYIGKESLALTNLLMTSSLSNVGIVLTLLILLSSFVFQVYSYNPTSQTAELESSRTNRLLMRRYAIVQKARDADVFGILVGTLGVGMRHLLNFTTILC